MIVRTSRAKAFAMFVGTVGVTWLCHHFANGGADWISGRNAGKLQFAFYLFAVLSVLSFFKFLASGRKVAEISSNGLLVSSVSTKLIAWSDISNMGVITKAGNESITFNIHPGSASAANVKALANAGKAVGSAVNVNGYTINLAMTGVSAEQFSNAVSAAMSSPQAAPRAAATSRPSQGMGSAPVKRFGKRAAG